MEYEFFLYLQALIRLLPVVQSGLGPHFLARLDEVQEELLYYCTTPGRSPGRAIVLPPASALASLVSAWALAKSLTLKFFI